MTSWTNPQTSNNHTDELAATRGRDESNALMDYSADANIPDNTIRWNDTANRFERWDAANVTWNALSNFYAIKVDNADKLDGISSSGFLQTGDLAANGGTVTQKNTDEEISGSWNFPSFGFTLGGEKALSFKGSSNGRIGVFEANTDSSFVGFRGFHLFANQDFGGEDTFFRLYKGDGTFNRTFEVSRDEGGRIGDVNTKGPGTLNAEGLYENGERAGLRLTADKTVNIPTDYSDLQAAFDDLLKFNPNGFTITLNIETGHALTKGLDTRNGDYRHFRITSTDTTVSLDANFTPASAPAGESFSENESPVFLGVDAHVPSLEILVNANNGDTTLAGYHIIRSQGNIASGAGVKNTGQMGLYCSNTSTLSATGAVFSGAGRGNRVTGNSRAHLGGGADLSNSQVNAASRAALDISRASVVTVASNSTQPETNLSGAAGDAINIRRANVAATFANVSGAGGSGINAQLASVVEADSINANNCGGRPVRAVDGSSVNVNDGVLTNSANEAILSGQGSRVSANNADVSGFTATNAAEVFGGSTIAANGMAGSPTFNVTTNTINGNGIIFE